MLNIKPENAAKRAIMAMAKVRVRLPLQCQVDDLCELACVLFRSSVLIDLCESCVLNTCRLLRVLLKLIVRLCCAGQLGNQYLWNDPEIGFANQPLQRRRQLLGNRVMRHKECT